MTSRPRRSGRSRGGRVRAGSGSQSLVPIGLQGEHQGEGGPLTLARLDLDAALVVVGHVTDDGQTEPGATGVSAPSVVDPIEPLEDSIEVTGGYPGAVIGHGDTHDVSFVGLLAVVGIVVAQWEGRDHRRDELRL